jgi:hypothetical protein
MRAFCDTSGNLRLHGLRGGVGRTRTSNQAVIVKRWRSTTHYRLQPIATQKSARCISVGETVGQLSLASAKHWSEWQDLLSLRLVTDFSEVFQLTLSVCVPPLCTQFKSSGECGRKPSRPDIAATAGTSRVATDLLLDIEADRVKTKPFLATNEISTQSTAH